MSRNYKNIWNLNSKLVNKSDYIDDYNAFSDYMNDVPDNHGPPPLLNFKYDILNILKYILKYVSFTIFFLYNNI